MRALPFSVLLLLSIANPAGVQAAGPRVRPALIGNGPKALINLIDTKKLVEKGSGSGLLNFQCHVGPSGEPINPVTFRATPGSEALEREVISALWRCRFIPAIDNGKPVTVVLIGNVVFVVADGKPDLRIYANQNHADIANGNDFIAPQLITETINEARLKDELAAGKHHCQQR